MPLVVCLCGERVEAESPDALVHAFFAHSDGAHPNIKVSEARRQNTADAIRRTGGWDGQREPITGEIEIRPLTPAARDDYLAFFDGDAFSDNPVWASCYCLSYCVASSGDDLEQRTAAENRAGRASMIASGEASGVMAYADGRVVGWCHAAPRRTLPLLDQTPEFESDDADRTGAIVCYVIPAKYRGQGLARKLLDGACDMLRDRGLMYIDVYPPKEPRGDAGSYHGKRSMYEAAGFEHIRDAGAYAVMRKRLS